MKESMLVFFVGMVLVLLSPNVVSTDDILDQNLSGDFTEVLFDDYGNEIVPVSEINKFETEVGEEDFIGPSIGTRSATGYTYKDQKVLSTKTYTNKLLKTLKTSSVWSTASNSSRPSISVTVSRSNSFSLSLSNGSKSFNISSTIDVTDAETYTAKPKAKGYRVSLGIYAKKVVAKRVRMSAYSNGSGKFSHYIYTNPTTFSGGYVGESHFK